MRCTSFCTTGSDSEPRGLDWISWSNCSSLTRLLPSKAMRLMTWFSLTVMISWLPRQVGRDRALDAFVDLDGVEPLAGLEDEVGADGVTFDAPVPFDDDRRRDLRDGIVRRCERRTDTDKR